MRSGMYGRIQRGRIPRLVDEPNLIEQWLAADAAHVGEGGYLQDWVGRINGIVASAPSDTLRPRFYGTEGLDSLLFSTSRMNTPAIPVPRNMTLYMKAFFSTAPNTSSNSTMMCMDIGGNTRSWHSGVSSTKRSRFVNFNANGQTGQAVELSGTVPLNIWQLIEGQRIANSAGAGTISAWADDLEAAIAAIAATYNAASSVVMSIGSRGAGVEYMNGYFNEIRLYGVAHDEATKARVRAEMMA